MKKIYVLLFSALLFINCEKKEIDSVEISDPNNAITLNGQPFKIYQGTIGGISIGDSGHTGITLTSTSTTDINIKNLTIDVPTFTKETLPGTYSYPKTENSLLLNDHLTNYMFFDGEEVKSTNLKTGTFTIQNNGGDNFSITLDLTMKDGKIFKGFYTGNFITRFESVPQPE